MTNRRTFVRAGVHAAALTALPGRWRQFGPSPEHPDYVPNTTVRTVDPSEARTLAIRAVEAAQAAGATYADARIVRDVEQVVAKATGREKETHGIGVRALFGGAWGFCASPYWTVDEAAQLGKDAVAQARDNARWIRDRVELAPAPVATGTWTNPFRIDPFSVTIDEKMDFIGSLDATEPYLRPEYGLSSELSFISCTRQDRTVATTEGALFAQSLYGTSGDFYGNASIPGVDWQIRATTPNMDVRRAIRGKRVGGAGWEIWLATDIRDVGFRLAEEARKRMSIPVKPVQIGRYTVVVDAATMAQFVALLVGAATDLDRIQGFDANTVGTSYLGTDPLALLGNFSYGTPLLSVSSKPTGRHWDDEGIEPAEYPVVTQGVLQDFATTREQATLLAPAYQKLGRPLRSNGAATSGTWSDQVTGGGADLVMAPGSGAVTFDDFVQSTPHGLAVFGGTITTDWQLRNCELSAGVGDIREIVAGRLGAFITNASITFNATDIWKNLVALGGATSVAGPFGGAWSKGQPPQGIGSSVRTVPGLFKELSVSDRTRKA